MLRLCSREEFDRYAEFAYELAADLTKSGYPTYCDGIKTKEMFIERCLKAFERDTEEILLFEHKGAVQGLIQLYWIPEDLYLSTNVFNIKEAEEQAIAEFLAYAGEKFNGYDLYLGFPAENKTAVEYLSGHDFECIEDDYNNTAFLDRINPVPESSGTIRIDQNNYDQFRILHDQIEGDMYWNSERIRESLEDWIIFVNEKDNKPQGAVYYTAADDGWYEIFGIDIDQDQYNPPLFKELLNTALNDTKQRNGRTMTFFCEKEYENIATECGFHCIGNYLCFKKHID